MGAAVYGSLILQMQEAAPGEPVHGLRRLSEKDAHTAAAPEADQTTAEHTYPPSC